MGNVLLGNRVMWLCRTCFVARMGRRNVIQGNRLMWLCRTYLKARKGIGGCAGHDSRLRRELETWYKAIE